MIQSRDGMESRKITVKFGADTNQAIDVNMKDLQLISMEVVGTVSLHILNIIRFSKKACGFLA